MMNETNNEFSAFNAFNLGSLTLREAQAVAVFNGNLLAEAEEGLTALYHASASKTDIARAYARVVRLQDRDLEIHNFIMDYLVPEEDRLARSIAALRG